jgi:hypothetical protein
MAGVVVFGEDAEANWSASSWLFDWVARYLVEQVNRENVTRELELELASGVRCFRVDRLAATDRSAVVDALRDVATHVEREVPFWSPTADKAAVVAHVDLLARLAERFRAQDDDDAR